MVTKLSAAKIATLAGINMVLANGDNPNIVYDIWQARKWVHFSWPKNQTLDLDIEIRIFLWEDKNF